MSKHALLSASGAKKWMACTPSPRLEGQFKDTRSNYAEEGTFAHEYAELILKKAIGLINKKQFAKEQKKLQTNSFYSQSLEDYIQNYTAMVLERFNSVSNAVMMLEQRLDFSQWVPEGFGTGDVVIIADGVLEIIDLKYGAGVPVSAEDNPQLKLYALGALNAFGFLYDVETVRMTIIQPRLDSVSSEDISVIELYKWADEEVVPKAKLAFEGKGELVSGEHCRFCKVKATCRKRVEDNLSLAKYDFKSPDLLLDEEIGEILLKAEQLQSWAKDIAEFAYEQSLNHGKKWTGWKLVEGRSTRKYVDLDKVATKLLADGFSEDKIYKKSLLGVTAMEKLLGKKAFESLLNDYIVKPPGKPALVVETDKRPEINSIKSAVSDFDDGILG